MFPNELPADAVIAVVGATAGVLASLLCVFGFLRARRDLRDPGEPDQADPGVKPGQGTKHPV